MSRLHQVACMVMTVLILVSLIAPVSAASYSTGTYTVAHANGVNVRKGPGTSHSVVGAAKKDTQFEVTKISSAWGYTSSIQTTTGKKAGWVNLDYCKAKKTTISFSSVQAPNNGNVVQGTGYHLTGKITASGSKLSSICGQVLNAQSKSVMSKTVSVDTSSYTLKDSKIDDALTFGKLSIGSYTLKYTVRTKDGTSATKSLPFKVSNKVSNGSPSTTTTSNTTKIPPVDAIFVHQSPSRCTAATAAMVMKAYCYQKGDSSYKKIKESTITNASEMWVPGGGLKVDFKIKSMSGTAVQGMHYNQYALKGSDSAKEQKIKEVLKSHPEGIGLYGNVGSNSHAIYMASNGKILDPYCDAKNAKYVNLSQSQASYSDSWSDITHYWVLEK